MKFWRIKHLPSGMYFCPSREIGVPMRKEKRKWRVKSNLSVDGKVYTRKPSLNYIGHGIWNHLKIQYKESFNTEYPHSSYDKFDATEWEIEEI